MSPKEMADPRFNPALGKGVPGEMIPQPRLLFLREQFFGGRLSDVFENISSCEISNTGHLDEAAAALTTAVQAFVVGHAKSERASAE